MHETILQLLADLYRQIVALQQENAQLKEQLAAKENSNATRD